MSNRNTRGDSTRVFNPDDIIVRERQTRMPQHREMLPETEIAELHKI